jgi:hypothetical protein
MQAMVVTAFGGPEVLTEAESPDPKPGPGQITIDTSHAGVGLIDVLLRRGDMTDNPGLPLLGHAAHTPDTPVTGDLLWLNSLDLVGFTITAYLQTYPAAHDRPPSTSCH